MKGQPEADFINCVAFGKTAEFMEKYIKKGYLVSVEGRIQTSSYEKQQGQRVYTTDIVCESVQNLTPRNSTSDEEGSTASNTESNNTISFESTLDISADDLPF